MITSRSRFRVRALRRLITVGAVLVSAVLAPAAAFADMPQAWDTPPTVSAWEFILVLLVLPIGAGLVLAVLASLPTMIRGSADWGDHSWRYAPQELSEGAAPAEALTAASGTAASDAGDQGGAGGSW